MPVFSLSINDTSPIWTYGGPWLDAKASVATNHTAAQSGASASISFNGTGISLLSTQDVGQNAYSVSLDGTVSRSNSSASSSALRDQLFVQNGLARGTHQVVLTDESAAPTLSLDSAVLTLGDGNTLTTAVSTTLDDVASNFTYSNSSGAWDDSMSNFTPFYYDRTMHRTPVANAQATLNFWGNHVELYGATSYNHGMFSVALDGAPPVTLNGTAPIFRAQTLLYMFSDLPDGPHTLVVTNNGVNGAPASFFDIDYAVVQSWGPPPPSTPASAPTTSQVHSSGLPPAAIAGITLGVLVWLALVALALVLVVRRRAGRANAPTSSQASFVGPAASHAEFGLPPHTPAPPAYEPSPATAVHYMRKVPWPIRTGA